MAIGTPLRLAVLLLALAAAPTAARADHALEFVPSFYPHEIRIEAVEPAAAAKLLTQNALHAYVGRDPFAGATAPAGLGHVDSLGSYLVLTFSTGSRAAGSRDTRCASGGRILSALAAQKGPYTFHPYPVTPYHADYLQHFDLAESARRQSEPRAGPAPAPLPLKIRPRGKLAEKLLPAEWRAAGQGWDATMEEIDLQELVSPARTGLSGRLGPPWIKEGWFHAYLLLATAVRDPAARRDAEEIYRRLVGGAYDGDVERLNLERKLVGLLVGGCERLVAGYTLRREYFNSSDYSEGLENIASDSQAGFNSPIFVRTVKLKDFLWNGWLRVGVDGKPGAAWNPLGGFTDAAGQLIWSAVGDPAQFPAPPNGSWVADRVTAKIEGSPSGRVEVPADALLPEAGTGALRPVGAGKIARAKILYRVLASAFHDQTRMAAADLLAPLSFAFRVDDPFVRASAALARDWLAGVRVIRVEQEVKELGETKLAFQVPIVEVYVTRTLGDPAQAAAVTPPWSALPWPLMALMEEAAKRGVAALSQDEARRRGLPWLDLVRDQRVKEGLLSLVEEFRRGGYVPASLKGLVTADEARARWAALQQFYRAHRHFLVTNGPYRLHQWTANAAVLQVFRDPAYPVGLGSFDQHTIPRRAYVSKIDLQGEQLTIRAEVEKVVRFQRTYKVVREPLQAGASDKEAPDAPVCRYVGVGGDGSVVAAGTARPGAAGVFSVNLKGQVRPGPYTLLVALYLGGNAVNPDVKTIRLTPPPF